jgi:arsenate reductase
MAWRDRLAPRVHAYLDQLSASVEPLTPLQQEACHALARWIAHHHRTGMPSPIIVICTGNSRRSMLGSTLGNLAATYHGLPGVRFFSGGTHPTAFNPRTIATLRAIGLDIQPTGAEAPRGEPDLPNPIYRIDWGVQPGDPACQCHSIEFSKKYSDPANPASGFAAIMVCDEADGACPTIPGADLRIPLPFQDPKSSDDSPAETAQYAERRDEIARVLLHGLLQAKRAIQDQA